jgi:hypothetical protein
MVESLRVHLEEKQRIAILALDSETEWTLNNQFVSDARVKVLNFQSFPGVNFSALRSSRSYVEFCWALGSVVSNEILLRHRVHTVYVDADTFFFGNPQPLVKFSQGFNASITPHTFPERLKHLEINGKYNVGWVSFSPTKIGIDISLSWRRNCELSTAYNAEDGVVGDQKYLDSWDSDFQGVYVVADPGVNLAPWNHENYKIEKSHGSWIVDGQPLVFYHFHGFATNENGDVRAVPNLYQAVKSVPKALYEEYFSAIRNLDLAFAHVTTAPLAARLQFAEPRLSSLIRDLVSKLVRSVRSRS